MDQNAARPTALLEQGGAQFTIPARADRQLTILAGDTIVHATSGELYVSRTGELATVRVTSGSVRVTYRGHDVTVVAAQSWSTPQETNR
jgi:ferric-dicitrate binding protein FerR (iron transport regulator)